MSNSTIYKDFAKLLKEIGFGEDDFTQDERSVYVWFSTYQIMLKDGGLSMYWSSKEIGSHLISRMVVYNIEEIRWLLIRCERFKEDHPELHAKISQDLPELGLARA